MRVKSLGAKCSLVNEKSLSVFKFSLITCVASQIWLWKGWTQNLTIWFNPFLQRFPKFVKKKHVILLFCLLAGLSDLIRYLKRRYIVFLSRHYFSQHYYFIYELGLAYNSYNFRRLTIRIFSWEGSQLSKIDWVKSLQIINDWYQ